MICWDLDISQANKVYMDIADNFQYLQGEMTVVEGMMLFRFALNPWMVLLIVRKQN